MKKHGVINSQLAAVLADLGHTDTICIGDCGLPIPNDVLKIDLAVKHGLPSFMDVLTVIDDDMVYEKVFLANEIKKENHRLHQEVLNILKTNEIAYVSHDELKDLTKHCKAVIRTGENTPYANIILQSGVYFGVEE